MADSCSVPRSLTEGSVESSRQGSVAWVLLLSVQGGWGSKEGIMA